MCVGQSLAAVCFDPFYSPDDFLRLLNASRLVCLLPTHTDRRSVYQYIMLSEIFLQRASRVPPPSGTLIDLANSSQTTVSVCPVKLALDTAEEIVVMVDAGSGGQLVFLDISCRVAFAIAGCALLVALVARQGACFHVVTGADIFWRVGVADVCVSTRDDARRGET